MKKHITSSQCFLSITHERVHRFTRFRCAASSCYYLHVATLKHTQVISHTGSLFIFSHTHTHTIFFSRLISHKYFFCLSSSFLTPPPLALPLLPPPPSAASPQLPECVPMHGHKCTQSIPPHSQPVIPNSPPWGKLAEGGGAQRPSEDRGRPTAGSLSGKKKRRKRKGPDER